MSCGQSTPGGMDASSTAARGVRAGGDLLGQQSAHAVADHDRGSVEAVVGLQRDIEAVVDAGPAQHVVARRVAAGKSRGVGFEARGLEEAGPGLEQGGPTEYTVEKKDWRDCTAVWHTVSMPILSLPGVSPRATAGITVCRSSKSEGWYAR